MSSVSPPVIKQRVRASALWAAIAAGLMLGYTYWGGRWEIVGGGAYRVGAQIFIHTLELGGWAMAVAALWMLTGMRPALAFDAVAAVVIGVLFMASGLLMFAGGGMQPLLNVIFGIVFISSGRNSWRQYVFLARAAEVPASMGDEPSTTPSQVPVRQSPPDGSLAGRLMERTRPTAEAPPPTVEEVPPPSEPPPPAPPEPEAIQQPPTLPAASPASPAPQPASPVPSDDEPPPEGYLAQLAKQKQPPDQS